MEDRLLQSETSGIQADRVPVGRRTDSRKRAEYPDPYIKYPSDNPKNRKLQTLRSESDKAVWKNSGNFSFRRYKNTRYGNPHNILVTLEPVSGEQTPLIDTSKQITQYSHDDSMTVISSGNEIIFFDRQGIEMCSYERKNVSDILISQGNTTVIGSSDSPNIWITKYSNHTDKEVAKYDPLYTHDEARLSADGTAVTLFSYDKFRICDTEGNIIKDVEIPDADNVYDQQYLRENGSSMLKVIYNDGSIDFYSANTGEKIDHTEESPPDRSLYEEFETSTMRIESPLHGTPKAYDKKTGKLISELSENAYLTYVTEVGDYVVAQYVTTDNNFFGYLMDQQCQILAYFPNVCDIYDNKILFDYPTGSIREERIYDINELQKIAREKLEEEVNDEV